MLQKLADQGQGPVGDLAMTMKGTNASSFFTALTLSSGLPSRTRSQIGFTFGFSFNYLLWFP